MKLAFNVFLRIIATFIANALAVIGTGAIVGVDLWLSALMGGILAVAKVVERLSVAFLEDGKITLKEINAIFSQVVTIKNGADDHPPTQAKAPARKRTPAKRKPVAK